MSPASPRSSSSSDSSDGRHSPINGFDSSAALILVPDNEDNPNTAFGFSSDDEDTDDEHDPQRERLKSSPIPPLSSTNVFLYLLLPFLKLGALLVSDTGLPLKIGLPALFLLAGLSALTRQLWYMLARYVRKADLEEIVLETFARGRGKERRRALIRNAVRVSVGVLRILLAAMYLRGAHACSAIFTSLDPLPDMCSFDGHAASTITREVAAAFPDNHHITPCVGCHPTCIRVIFRSPSSDIRDMAICS